MLLEGNPYFLGITFFVSILHSVFDMLAFKNDIGFWKGKKNVEGLSVRTVAINCVCQVRIVLSPSCVPPVSTCFSCSSNQWTCQMPSNLLPSRRKALFKWYCQVIMCYN